MLFTPPPPQFNTKIIGRLFSVRKFVQEIVTGYPLVIHLPFVNEIFAEGILPRHPIIHTDLIHDQHTLNNWFVDQASADIFMLQPAVPQRFEYLLDQIDRQISRSLLEYGTIAARYDLYPYQYGKEGLKKIQSDQEVQVFKENFLTEAVLNSEFEIITMIYYQLWGILYAVKT